MTIFVNDRKSNGMLSTASTGEARQQYLNRILSHAELKTIAPVRLLWVLNDVTPSAFNTSPGCEGTFGVIDAKLNLKLINYLN